MFKSGGRGKSRRSSKMKRDKIKNVCMAGLVLLVIILIAVIFAVRFANHNNNNNNSNKRDNSNNSNNTFNDNNDTTNSNNLTDICLSTDCFTAANRILDFMNLSADPCEDFEKFACGKFLDKFILPENLGKYDSYFKVEEIIYRRGKVIMEEEEDKEEWPAMKKARTYYKSCMDTNKLEKLGLEPLKEILRFFGGWPVIEGDNWEGDNFTWKEAIGKMGRQGFRNDFIVTLTKDVQDSDATIKKLNLLHENYGLSRRYLQKGLNGSEVQEYFNYMKRTAMLMGANVHRAEVEMEEALKFELALAEIATSDHLDSRHTYPTQFWVYLRKLRIPISNSASGEPFYYISNTAALHNISVLLNNDTKPRVLANYLGWRAIESVLHLLNSEAFNLKQTFQNAIEGIEVNPQRWKVCLNQVGFNAETDVNFRIPVSSVYVEKYFDVESKKEITAIIKSIMEAFKSDLQQLDWLDNVTRSNAVKKLDNMVYIVGYPEELLNRTKIENLFEDLNVSEDDYLGNYNRLILWDKRLKLESRVDIMEDWIDLSKAVVTTHAFNDQLANIVVIPAGISQGIFYGKNLPKYLNFGAIGNVIAHEMMHGFDTNGIQYYYYEKLSKPWGARIRAIYDKNTECLRDQYNRTLIEKYGYNQSLKYIMTPDEDIADNGGINQAYRAYDRWVNSTGIEEPRLPGLKHITPQQLFFISYGQLYCNKNQAAALKEEVDINTPDYMRLTLPLTNSKDFSKAFGCKLGSKMNPVEKCRVW